MRYLGGKSKIAKRIGYILNQQECSAYYEPFCGALWVSLQVKHLPMHLSDVHPGLITMYKALRAGWVPPTELSEKKYVELRERQDMKDPLTAFAGFGCSFAGMYYRCYARDAVGHNYALSAHNSLLKTFAALPARGLDFKALRYQDLKIADYSLVYCDPPYAGTTEYASTTQWDVNEFWQWVCDSSQHSLFVVSEYQAPEGFVELASWETHTGIHVNGNVLDCTEKLFIPEYQQKAWRGIDIPKE